MARIRTIKPEFWVSEQVAECSPLARLLFIGMWNFCDDHGVHPDKPKTLKALVFPHERNLEIDEFAGLLDELVNAGLVDRFTNAGREYVYVTGWKRHQKIERPTFKHPAPPTSDTAEPNFGE